MKYIFPGVLYGFLFLLTYCQPTIEEPSPKTIKVTGAIADPAPENRTVYLAINRVGHDDQEVLEANLDEENQFEFSFSSYVPIDFWLAYRTNILVVAHPGDSLNVRLDGQMEWPAVFNSLRFSGDRTLINKQITAFKQSYYNSAVFNGKEAKHSAMKNYGPERFKIYADSLQMERTKLYKNFISENTVNSEVKNWIKFSLQEDYISDLTWYPNTHRSLNGYMQGEWSVPISYYDYFNKMKITRETLNCAGAVSGYVNKYLYSYLRLEANSKNPQKNVGTADDSILLQTIIEKTKGQPLLRELTINQYSVNLIKESNLKAFEDNIDIIRSNIKSTYLKESLFKAYKQAKLAIENTKLSANVNVKTISGNEVIQKIMDEHRNKAIYIDIWATWCDPCLREFPFSKKLHAKLLKSDTVDFIYICVDSKEDAYINTLKKFQLSGTHYFLDNKQSQSLRKELNIEGVPHYLIIDKKGDQVNTGFDARPSNPTTEKTLLSLAISK